MTMMKSLFLSMAMGAATLFVAKGATDDVVRGFYWIDSDSPVAFTVPPSEIDAGCLKDGFHTFNLVAYKDHGVCSTPASTMFVKVPKTEGADSDLTGTLFLDGRLHSTVTMRNVSGGMFTCEADMGNVAPGVHNIQLLSHSTSGTTSNVVNTWFLRVPTDYELSSTKVAYFIDGQYVGQKELSRSGIVYLTDIDTSTLESGIHSIDISLVMTDGTMTSFEHSWFYRVPIPNGITAYDYWFDDDYQHPVTVALEQTVSDLGLTTMVDIPELPFDSRKYAFSVKDGTPSIQGKHTLNMRFYESDGRAINKMSDFAESRTTLPVENVDTLRDGINHVKTTNANEIKWYKFYGEVGDSIAVSSNRQSMYELFSPTGAELIKRSGPRSQAQNTLTLLESGTYYFAAHNPDIKSRSDFDVSFSHVPRNAILTVSPDANVSDSPYTLMELFGNGMNDAKSVVIQSAEGTRFETDGLMIWDNYHLSGTIQHTEEIPLGVYDVSMVVVDRITGEEKTIVKPQALTVVNSSAKPNIKVEVVPSKKASTPYMVDIIVTNDSEVPCWGVPFNIACEREGGKNGFVFYMRDFLGSNISANTIPWFESDNILGTGTDGIFFPTVITNMHPHEKRKLRVGIISEPHHHVGLYAWAGTPYSEEARQLRSIPEDSLKTMSLMYSNIFDIKTTAYILTALEEIKNRHNTKLRASTQDNRVLEYLADYGPDVIGHYTPFEDSSNAASQVASTYVALAKTEASIFNLGVKGRTAHEQLTTNCGYSGTPQQVIMQIEAEFQNCEEDPSNITNPQTKMWYIELKNAMAKAVPPEEIVRDVLEPTEAKLASDVCDIFLRRNAESQNPMPTRNDIDVFMSGDPNMLTGYSDPSGGNYVGIDVKKLDYTIEFENDPLIATAAASTIVVENSLDGSVFDLTSFVPEEIRIGKHTVSVPDSHHFVKTVDMRPEIQCIAEIRFDYDEVAGKAVWQFESLDPITLNPIIDFRQGLLPVNDGAGRGIGYIDYSIRVKDKLQHNTTIDNKAVITFDDNDPIETPVWSNVTDYKRPESAIIGNTGYSDGCYTLAVDYHDEGSGVYTYDLYIRTSDDDDWYVVKSGLTDTEIRFETPEEIPGIEFMTIATDQAGNRQITKDYVTGVESPEIDGPVDSSPQQWYNLQGIPVPDTERGSTPGLRISNDGRKVIVH